MRKQARRLIAATVAIGLGAFLVDQAPSSAATHTVTVRDFAFSPQTIQIAVGDTVTWTNQDSSQHTATADDGSFHVPLNAGASGSATFTKAGTIAYGCNVHITMRGTVQVGPGGAGTTTTAVPTTTTTRQPTTTAGGATTTTAARPATATTRRATTTTAKPKPKRCRKGFRRVRVRSKGRTRTVCRRIKR